MNEALKRVLLVQDPGAFLEPDKTGSGWVCPLCGSGSGPKGTGLQMMETKDPAHPYYWCWDDRKRFDLIALYRHKTDVDSNTAIEQLCDIYKLDPDNLPDVVIPESTHGIERPKSPVDLSVYFKRCAYRLDHDSQTGMEYMRKLGLSCETLTRFNVGFDPEFLSDPWDPKIDPTPAIIIPTSAKSCFVRNIGSKGARFPKIKGTRKELFNAEALRDGQEPVFVTEGAIDAMSIYEAGHKSVVGLPSKGSWSPLIKALKSRKSGPSVPLVLCLDHDPDPGKEQKSEAELFACLDSLGIEAYRENILPEGCKDPNEALIKDPAQFQETVKAALERVKEASRQRANEQQTLPPGPSDAPSNPVSSPRSAEGSRISAEQYDERWIQGILNSENKPTKWDFYETDMGGNKKFRHDIMAKYLIRKMGIIIFRGRPHVRVNGVYRPDSKEKPMIEYIISDIFPDSKSGQRHEVMESIRLLAPQRDDETRDPYLMAFENGILDIKSGELMAFDDTYLMTCMVPWRYDPTAYHSITDDFLDSCTCGDKEIRETLEEMIGYCFIRACPYEKGFFLLGSGANGKSVLLKAISFMLGNENVTAMDLRDVSQRFRTVLLENKLANIQSDITAKSLDDESTADFRKIVSGDQMTGEYKGQTPYSFYPHAKMIFSANELPGMGESGIEATLRRFCIIPFNARYTPQTPGYDPELKEKLQTREAAEYLIALGVKGARRLIERGGLKQVKAMEKELENYEFENHPVKSWIREVERQLNENVPPEERPGGVRGFMAGHTVDQAYEKFGEFLKENGLDVMKRKNQFSKEVQDILNLSTDRPRIEGKKTTVFTIKKKAQ